MRRLLPAPVVEPADLDEAYAWPAGGCVRVNFVSSLDGAATVGGRSGPLGGEPDRAGFQHLRRSCDVVLVGAGTAKAERYRPVPVPVAVVSRRLSLDPAEDRLLAPLEGTARPIVLAPASAPADRRAALEPHADVVACGDDDVDLATAVAELRRRGLHRILCEGGPSLLADLLAADLVDELCLTLAPTLVGGGEPRIVEGAGLLAPRDARLVGLLEEDGVLLGRWSLR